MSKKRRRKPSASATINASLQMAAESAEEFLRLLDEIAEREQALKQTCSASSPAPAAVTK